MFWKTCWPVEVGRLVFTCCENVVIGRCVSCWIVEIGRFVLTCWGIFTVFCVKNCCPVVIGRWVTCWAVVVGLNWLTCCWKLAAFCENTCCAALIGCCCDTCCIVDITPCVLNGFSVIWTSDCWSDVGSPNGTFGLL